MENTQHSTGAYYMRSVPNSHWFTDLQQIVQHFKYAETGIVFEKPIREYLIIGLNNSIKHGYKLKQIKKLNTDGLYFKFFVSIDGLIAFLNDETIDINEIRKYVENTINAGLNLNNGIIMERTEVYKRLDGERAYQDSKWGTRREADGTPDEEKPVAEWINYIEYHLAKAKEKVYHLDTQAALAELRKVTALGVRAMEIHGCPARQIEAGDGTKPTELDKPNCCDNNCDCKKER